MFYLSLTLYIIIRDVSAFLLRSCRDVGAGLLLTMSCALLLDGLAARLGVAWLLSLGVSVIRCRALLDYSF